MAGTPVQKFGKGGGRFTSVAATYLDAAHPYPAAACDDGPAHDDRAAMSGAAGAVHAAGADHRVGVGRLDGHGGGKGEDGGGNEQNATHVDLPDLSWLILLQQRFCG